MIARDHHQTAIWELVNQFPVVALTGARQVGKTTLARTIAERFTAFSFFDLENPVDLSRLIDPMLTLNRCTGLVVLDEVQQRPDLFQILRVLADRPGRPASFLILGSASPDLVNRSSESLAGRIAYYNLPPFSVREIGIKKMDQLWLRGGFPLSFLNNSEIGSAEWRRQFLSTFLTRDIPQLGIQVSGVTIRRFWTMLAHYHGQIWNASEFSRSFGVADTTIRRYLDILQSTCMVFQLPPWFENLKKRQVKSPKVYLSDTGILHSLLNVNSREDLECHPKVGASWEGFAINVIRGEMAARDDECFFWATHAGSELDLLISRGRNRFGFEFKRTASPSITPSMRSAMQDLRLDKLFIVHAGDASYDMTETIQALSLYKTDRLAGEM
jgi:uncharacterized protein